MTSQLGAQPGRDAINAILRFIDIFSAPGFDPLLSRAEKAARGLPAEAALYPVNHPQLDQFLATVMQPCWLTTHPDSDKALTLLQDDQRIASASQDDIRLILSGYLRGERFCDGFHALMISNGQIIKVLKRIAEIFPDNSSITE